MLQLIASMKLYCGVVILNKKSISLHRLLIGYFIVIHLNMITDGQNICPSYASCTAVSSETAIVTLKCSHLGNLSQVPPCFSTQKPIYELTIDSDGTTEISKIQPYAFWESKIVKLILEELQIKTIDVVGFGGLNNDPNYLQVLYLGGNLLSDLPNGVFLQIPRLTQLQLQSNKLDRVTQGNFTGLLNLTLLNLDNNRIQFVQNRSFVDLHSLQVLSLQNNLLQNITKETFAGLFLLKSLYLRNNSIQSLSSDVFSYLVNLANLDLSSNAISSLPDNLFVSTTVIESINLSSNAITSLIKIAGLTSLTDIYLNDNLISDFPTGMFNGLDNLKTLHLQNNRITFVDANSLTGIPNLIQLNLGNNKITSLSIGLFDHTGGLTTLNVSSNNITTMEKNPFTALSHLTDLDMSNNNIKHISSDWFKKNDGPARTLTTLRLNQNKISTIDNTTFQYTEQLQWLNLADNQLTADVIQGIFVNCTNLQTLLINSNPLQNVDEKTFAGIYSLQNLYLNSLCLESILIQNLPNLNELHLQHNFITTVTTDTFLGLNNLRILDLGYNFISDIEAMAFDNLQLTALNLTHNRLGSDQVVMMGTSSQISSGMTVDLSWNRITDLDNFPMFQKFYLTGNPISCSCNILQNVTLLSFADYNATVCNQSMSNTSMLVVCFITDKDVCPQSTRSLGLPNNTQCYYEFNNNYFVQSRINEMKKCGFNVSDGVDTSNRHLLFLSLQMQCDGLHVTWNQLQLNTNFTINITWQLDQSGFQLVENAVQNTYTITNLTVTTTDLTVCIQLVFGDSLQTSETLCNRTGSVTPVCSMDEKSTGDPYDGLTVIKIILYIVVPAVAFLLLIIISVVITVLVVRNRDKRFKPDFVTMSESVTTSDKEMQQDDIDSSMAEQTVVSLSMFEPDITAS